MPGAPGFDFETWDSCRDFYAIYCLPLMVSDVGFRCVQDAQ